MAHLAGRSAHSYDPMVGNRATETWVEARLLRTLALGESRFARFANTASLAALVRRERQLPYRPLAEIEALQRRRVASAVRHAYETVPFFRSVLEERGLGPADFRTADDLRQLPLLDGADLVADPVRFVSEPFRSEEHSEIFRTSGASSGLRKQVYVDHASLLLRAAYAERDRVVLAHLAGEHWAQVVCREFVRNERRHALARLAGIDLVEHQRLLILPAGFSARTPRAINSERSSIPKRAIHYHHLAPTAPLEVVAAHLAAIRPRVVFSFGSFADQFFRFLHASGEVPPLPRVWVYLGEMLSPEGRRLAESMGCRVYSVYSAAEGGRIAFQCEERSGFHLNIDQCAVHVVDSDGRDVPAGEPGEVVISPLNNRATMLFNYRLGDRAAISPEPCPCGRSLPVLARLEGRRSEAIRLADGRVLDSMTLESLFAAELRETIKAQIEQEAPGRLRWRIVPARNADPGELRRAFLARARFVLGAATSLEVELVDDIPLTAAGKFVRAVVKDDVPREVRDATS